MEIGEGRGTWIQHSPRILFVVRRTGTALACGDAECEVRKTGSRVLLAQIDPPREVLASANLKSFLAQRRWQEFHEIVSGIIDAMDTLCRDAARF